MAKLLALHWAAFNLLAVFLPATDAQTDGLKFLAKPWSGPRFVNDEDDVSIDCTTDKVDAKITLAIYNAGLKDAFLHFKDRLKQIGQNFEIKIGLGDGFQYTCKAIYKGNVYLLDLGTIVIIPFPKVEIPVVTPSEEPFLIEYGGQRNITCTVRGSPHSSKEMIQWERTIRGKNVTIKAIDPSTVMYLKTRKSGVSYHVAILMIKLADYNIAGEYFCVREYKKIKTATMINVDIEAMVRPQSSILTPTYQVFREGNGSIVALCNASGSPRPTKAWYKDGALLESCNNRSSSVCEIRISAPRFPQENGTFECRASNMNGTAISYFFVFVQVPVKLKKPTKEIVSSNTVMVNLTCEVERANPLPQFHWQYQPYRCDEDDRCEPGSLRWLNVDQHEDLVTIKTAQRSSRLLIQEANNEHFYRCIANNSFSKDVYTFALRRSGVLKSTVTGLSTPVMIAIVVCIVFFAFLAVSSVFWHRRKLQRKYAPFLKPNPNFQYDHSVPLLDQCTRLPYDPDWEFPRARLTMVEPIGSGAFGEVWLAEAEGILVMRPRNKSSMAAKRRNKLRRSLRYASLRRKGARPRPGSVSDDFIAKTEVAVKTLKEDASPNEYKDLASELKILIHLGEHNNIVNLLGACTQDGSLCIILEYCPNGNLLNFLRERREIFRPVWYKSHDSIELECTYLDLLVCAYQIAKGMEFLASKKCVHRDLAARNILVSTDYVMKIADFGLARDVYKDDFYWKSTGGLLPAKWMSPEALFDKIYTEQSDIWSFGILLWEIFTLGGSPYPGLQTEELFSYLQEGKRMDPPYMCPDGVYSLMRDCWESLPGDRPPFHVIVESLLRTLNEHVDQECPYLNLQDRLKSISQDLDGIELHGATPQRNNEYLKLKNGSASSWDSVDHPALRQKNSCEDMDDSPFYSKLKSPPRGAGSRPPFNPVVEYKSIGHDGRPRVVRLDTQMSTISDEI